MSTILLSSLEVPLTFRQYRTLTRVASGCTSPSQLAAIGILSLPTVSENVEILVRRGLMTTSQSASDRRVVVLQVTEEGLRAAKAGTTEALPSRLSPERRRDLSDSLRVIYDAATDYLEDFLQRGAR